MAAVEDVMRFLAGEGERGFSACALCCTASPRQIAQTVSRQACQTCSITAMSMQDVVGTPARQSSDCVAYALCFACEDNAVSTPQPGHPAGACSPPTNPPTTCLVSQLPCGSLSMSWSNPHTSVPPPPLLPCVCVQRVVRWPSLMPQTPPRSGDNCW